MYLNAKTKKLNKDERRLKTFFGTMFLMLGLTLAGFGQTNDNADLTVAATKPETQQATENPAVRQPVLVEIKGVKIGMTADQIKDILGKPKVDDATGFYYIFDDGESVQIEFDADKNARMIANIYSGKKAVAPKFEQVFGAGTEFEAQPDGKIYKLVEYPDAGFWIAYSQIKVGDGQMVTVTMQKIR